MANDGTFQQALMMAGGFGALQWAAGSRAQAASYAELEDMANRELQAIRMRQTISNLKFASEHAAETGARILAGGIAKEAYIPPLVGGLGRSAGAALGSVGKGLGQLGRSGANFRFQQAAHRLGEAATAPGTTGLRGALRRTGVGLQQAGKDVAGGATKFQHNAVLGKPGEAPLIGGLMKAKLLAGGAALGAGYVGLQGAKSAVNYVTEPHHGPAAWGLQGPNVRQGVTEFGY